MGVWELQLQLDKKTATALRFQKHGRKRQRTYKTRRARLTISVCGRRWCWTQPGCRPWCRCRLLVDGGFAACLRDTGREEVEEIPSRVCGRKKFILNWSALNLLRRCSSPGPASRTCWWGWCCQGGGYQTPGCGSVGRTLSFLGSRAEKDMFQLINA